VLSLRVPIHNLLEDTIRVTIANPKWVQAVKGNKDDTKDSKWIGDLFRLGLVPESYIPSKPTRILREYTRYRSKLVSCKSSEKNRFQNAFTVCNVALFNNWSNYALLDVLQHIDEKFSVALNHVKYRRFFNIYKMLLINEFICANIS
jgi:hypothetical protein